MPTLTFNNSPLIIRYIPLTTLYFFRKPISFKGYNNRQILRPSRNFNLVICLCGSPSRSKTKKGNIYISSLFVLPAFLMIALLWLLEFNSQWIEIDLDVLNSVLKMKFYVSFGKLSSSSKELEGWFIVRDFLSVIFSCEENVF